MIGTVSVLYLAATTQRTKKKIFVSMQSQTLIYMKQLAKSTQLSAE